MKRLWQSIPGVRTVVLVPRKATDPANRRVFIVTTGGPDLDQAARFRALGRLAARHPILELDFIPPADRAPLPRQPATLP